MVKKLLRSILVQGRILSSLASAPDSFISTRMDLFLGVLLTKVHFTAFYFDESKLIRNILLFVVSNHLERCFERLNKCQQKRKRKKERKKEREERRKDKKGKIRKEKEKWKSKKTKGKGEKTREKERRKDKHRERGRQEMAVYLIHPNLSSEVKKHQSKSSFYALKNAQGQVASQMTLTFSYLSV